MLPHDRYGKKAMRLARRSTPCCCCRATPGPATNWFRPTLADELFKPGQPLDPAKYYIIIPDALGRGGSSRPSDGLKGRSAHYRYHDMVDLTHQLSSARWAEGRPFAPDHRQFARLHATISVGRVVSGIDGRHGRAVVPTGRDQRAQLHAAPRRRRAYHLAAIPPGTTANTIRARRSTSTPRPAAT